MVREWRNFNKKTRISLIVAVVSVSRILMLARGTAIQKQFLVPLFALQAPQSVVAWMR